MVSDRRRCIFVHVPRTGGTSIESSFKWHNEAQKHYSARSIYNQVGDKKWDSYFKFTFVRNPWDRAVSLWHQPANTALGPQEGHSLGFFLSHHKPPQHEQGNTLCDYLNHGDMDFIGRFENRGSDLEYISQKIGFPLDPKAHHKKTSHAHYRTYYDDETKEMVAQKYAQDIKCFDYEF